MKLTNLFLVFICKIFRLCVPLRYRVEIKGLENLTPERLNRKGGIIFMPNHPALIDPLILTSILWPKYRMRPLIVEYIYWTPFVHFLAKNSGGLFVPEMDKGVNQMKIRKTKESMNQILETLRQGKNIFFYPAGGLKRTGKELLGGASGAHAILQECPEANVVLIRTTGLWGSSFSWGADGKRPTVKEGVFKAARTLFKNLIFFCPRRKLTIEIEANPEEVLKKKTSRVEFNRSLENWYNQYRDEEGGIRDVEPQKLVSYSFYRKEIPSYTPLESKKLLLGERVTVPLEVKTKIEGELRKILNSPDLIIKPEMNLYYDLGLDSLNMADLSAFLMKNYNIGELYPDDLETIEQVLQLAAGAEPLQRDEDEAVPTFTWREEKERPNLTLPVGKTIPEAFLRTAKKFGKFSACADDTLGIVSYKKLTRSIAVLATHFRTFSEKNIGIMLPASSGAYIVILALQLAGKVPVVLNWTLGSRYLNEMMKLASVTTVISSMKFLDRLNHVDFGEVIDHFLPMEEIRRNLTWGTKLKGAFLSLLPFKTISSAFHLSKIDENSSAVILFTSGTEATPKGVPLSHKNILSNIRAGLSCLTSVLTAKDVMYAVLPPFHSFGFSMTGITPFLTGWRVAFYPDPTDSLSLCKGIKRWKATFFVGTPSFIKGLFHVFKEDQLQTVRIYVSGAEKAPQELYDRIRGLGTGAVLLEGYGITECSPGLCLNRPNLPPRGVGQLLPGIEGCTIHPETLELLPEGAEGELCVRGPNVFNGYLGNPRSPFIEINQKKWYRTGDLGRLEKDKTLLLSGRLKRFTKIGGEMISLVAIETVLISELIRQKMISPDVPSLAVCADEKDGSTRLVLFVTISLSKETVNDILSKAGFSRLVKIHTVQKIEEIPLLGIGKLDYRRLQSLVG